VCMLENMPLTLGDFLDPITAESISSSLYGCCS
jgi:hypothetical protein